MIELTFSDSTAGTLKLAKQLIQDKPGSICPLAEGGPEDVLPLTLDLDIGDLSDIEAGMDSRRKLYDNLFSHYPGVPEEIMNINQRALERLKEAAEKFESVRMWVCASDPSELCGLYFVCHLFSDSPASLSVVRVPAEFVRHPKLIFYRSTGEIALEDFEALSENDEPLGTLQREFYAQFWRELAAENAPLRAVLNGRVVGVPEDFYDFALRSSTPDGEFRTAQLLGNALNKLPGVGDSWLYRRVKVMVEAGELVEVSPPTDDYPYSGMMKRG
jgi:hypothetical protein